MDAMPEIERLEERLRKIERTLEDLRSATGPINATSFRVRDADGRDRAVLGLNEEGNPVLSLNSTSGAVIVKLEVNSQWGNGLRIAQENAAPRITLISAQEHSFLHVLGPEGFHGPIIDIQTSKEPSIILSMHRELNSLLMGLTEGHGPEVTLSGTNGTTEIGVTEIESADGQYTWTSTSSLRLLDGEGKVIAKLP